jgi:LacI family transcriptional regulator
MGKQTRSENPQRREASRQWQVALLAETGVASSRDILRGVGRFARERGNWALVHERCGWGLPLPQWIRDWRGDGIIARVHHADEWAILSNLGIPVVDVLGEVREATAPLVHVDNQAIARIAAEHFLELGFRNFGFFGLSGKIWSELRNAAFQEILARSGHGVAVYEQSSEYRLRVGWEHRESRLADWVRRLPKPAGVLVCSDQVGLDFLEACRHAGVAVPDEVSVVGVDNDDMYCGIATPTLTSIWPAHTEVGYQAAALLEKLMRGEAAPREPVLISPGGIEVRQSSETLAINDPSVAKAISVIRAKACAGLDVDEVAEKAGLSRSVLQRRFRKILGKSVHDEILNARLKRACQLLAETRLPLLEIAEQSGFNHQEYMGVIFRERLKQTPVQYRRKNMKLSIRSGGELRA